VQLVIDTLKEVVIEQLAVLEHVVITNFMTIGTEKIPNPQPNGRRWRPRLMAHKALLKAVARDVGMIR
jgi:hypothetical protein